MMNSFGLGLILNFVDNASSGISSATRNFENMSAVADGLTTSVTSSATEMMTIAYSLNAVGDTFVSIGESITSVFTGITQQVIDTGMTMQGYRMQLTALYGTAEAGEAKMNEIKQYAMSSVFEVQSLIPAVTMMKAVGIEAMQEITTSSGEHTQKLLDYASDIAAMVPNMRNTYGTGVQAAMGAMKEYIAEGNALSLKRGAGLDITGILGEDKGATIEERTQQVADLVEKLNIVGYTAQLAGTPMQRLSNMQDALFNSLSQIADSGVFEVYCGLLESLSEWVFSLVNDEETFNTITGILADTISTLISPLQKVLDLVIENGDAIINWIKEHPTLTKNILLTVAALGAFLVVGGLVLKMLSSIAFAGAGLQFFKKFPSLLSGLGGSFTGLISKILPFIALASLAYFVWDNNLFNIKESMTSTFKDLSTVISLVKDAWEDNELSADNFIKAKELGILPLIEALLQLKYYWDYFVEGFKEGFSSFFDSIVESLSWLQVMGIDINSLAKNMGEFLDSLIEVGAEDKWSNIGEVVGQMTAAIVTFITLINVIKPVISIITKIGSVFKGIVSTVKTLGSVFGVLFKPLVKAWPFVSSIFKSLGPHIVSIGTKIGALLPTIGSAISGVASAVGGAISSALAAIAGFLGISVGWVVAIIVAIVAVVAAIVIFRDEIAQFFSTLWDKIKEGWDWLCTTVPEVFSNMWESIKTWFESVKTWFEDIVTKVKEVISNIVNAILESPFVQAVINVVTTVITFIQGIISVIVAFISNAAQLIWNIIKGVASVIVTIAQGIWGVVKGIVNIIVSIIKAAVNVISSIVKLIYQVARLVFYSILLVVKTVINFIVNAFNKAKTFIINVLQAIGNFFSTIFNWIYTNVVQPVLNWIVNAFNTAKAFITSVLQSIRNFFSSVFNWIKSNVLSPFLSFVSSIFTSISTAASIVTSWLSNAFSTAVSKITSVFNTLTSAFSRVFSSIRSGASSFFSWIGGKLSWISGLISSISSAFTSVVNKVSSWVSNGASGLKSMVGLDTGGYVKTTGIAVLHPNEVVVNDDTTRRLQAFLSQYEDNQGVTDSNNVARAVVNNIYPTLMESVPVTTVPTEQAPVVTNNTSVMSSPTTQNFIQQPTPTVSGDSISNDYSVTFAAGSIVFQLSGSSTEEEIEKAAEKLMKIIERKQQLQAMAKRK